MRFLKRLFRVLILVLMLGTIALAVLYYMSNRTPDGYLPLQLSEAERDAAAKRFELQKMPRLLNLANESAAKSTSAHRAQARGGAAPDAATQPADSVTVSFTQDEINSSIWKLAQTDKFKADYGRHLADPFVSLKADGSIVVMATVQEFGRVASAYFEPKLDENGQLRFDLTSLKVGSLPLPEAVLSKKRAQVEASLRQQIAEWQKKAKIDPAGVANAEAAAIAQAQFVLQSLNHQPSPAVIFMPKDVEKGQSKTVPLRLTDVKVDKGELTITVRPMNPAERADLLDQIQKPTQAAAADAPQPPKG